MDIAGTGRHHRPLRGRLRRSFMGERRRMADLASVAGMAGRRGGHIVGVGAVGARAVLGIGMAVAGKVCNPGLSIKMGFSPRRFGVRCYRIDSEFVARHLRACPGAQGHQHDQGEQNPAAHGWMIRRWGPEFPASVGTALARPGPG